MNVQETANILMTAATEYANVKRNKSGSVNEHSRYAIWNRARNALVAAGNPDGAEMAFALERRLGVK